MVAQTGVPSWSKTANSNATADGTINWAEGQSPSSVNDSARAMMARIAEWRDDLNGTNVTAGTTTAYTLTTDTGCAALAAGYEVAFQVDQDCGATVTLNIDSLGAKPLRRAAGVELVAGALKAGAVYRATYFTSNSGEWILQNYTPTIIAADQVVTASILNANVTYAKIQNVTNKRVLGNGSGSAAAPSEYTAEQILAWIGTPAGGDILYDSGSAIVRLAKGADGTFLTLASGIPAWSTQTVQKISAASASNSASLAFTSSIDSTYRKYVFEIDNLLPATDDVQLICEVSTDAGSNWKTNTYLSGIGSTDGSANSVASSTSAIVMSQAAGGSIGVDNGAGYGWNGSAELITPSNTSNRKTVLIKNGSYLRGGGTVIQTGVNGSGFWNGANDAINGIRFRFSSGNITSGTITMYGVKG